MSKKKEDMKKIALYELKKKDELIAVVLSLFITGAGHWYLGKWGKGFMLLFIQIALWFVLLGWIMWIITPILAYKDCKRYNKILQLELGVEND